MTRFMRIDIDRLEVGEVHDAFERAPLAGDRPRDDLLARHAGDRLPQLLWGLRDTVR